MNYKGYEGKISYRGEDRTFVGQVKLGDNIETFESKDIFHFGDIFRDMVNDHIEAKAYEHINK